MRFVTAALQWFSPVPWANFIAVQSTTEKKPFTFLGGSPNLRMQNWVAIGAIIHHLLRCRKEGFDMIGLFDTP